MNMRLHGKLTRLILELSSVRILWRFHKVSAALGWCCPMKPTSGNAGLWVDACRIYKCAGSTTKQSRFPLRPSTGICATRPRMRPRGSALFGRTDYFILLFSRSYNLRQWSSKCDTHYPMLHCEGFHDAPGLFQHKVICHRLS